MAIAVTWGEPSHRLDATEASPLPSSLGVIFAGSAPPRIKHELSSRLKRPVCGEPADDLVTEPASTSSRRSLDTRRKKMKKLVDKSAKIREKFVILTRMSRHEETGLVEQGIRREEMQLSLRLDRLPADLADARQTLNVPVPPDENALR
jgi:hypothetical protein